MPTDAKVKINLVQCMYVTSFTSFTENISSEKILFYRSFSARRPYFATYLSDVSLLPEKVKKKTMPDDRGAVVAGGSDGPLGCEYLKE